MDIPKYITRKRIIVVFLILFSFFSFIFINPGEENAVIKMVSGTEYVSGEQGQVIVRVTDRKGEGLRGVDCRATVLYPDKFYFLLDAPMIESTVPGNYYAAFTTPLMEGIYEEIIVCTNFKNEDILKISSSFHVSKALNYVINLSEAQEVRFLSISSRIDEIESSLEDVNEFIVTNVSIGINNLEERNEELIEDKFGNLYGEMAKAMIAAGEVYSNSST